MNLTAETITLVTTEARIREDLLCDTCGKGFRMTPAVRGPREDWFITEPDHLGC